MHEANGKRKIGIYIATSLVVGNMIGSGIFLLPASLAAYGSISLFGWLVSGIGALFLALVFGRLSKLIPKTGGPYIYTRSGFGDFAGFLVGWSYWISVICTNAAIAVAFAGYLTVFFPLIGSSNLLLAGVSISAIWFLTWINSRGIKSGGQMQLITAVIKIIPLLAISFVGLFFLKTGNFFPLNVSGTSDFVAIGATITLTLFALLGMECATIPADNIKNPTRNIPRATIIGTSVTVIIYLMSNISIMGLIPQSELAQSNAPFADAAFILWGDTGKYLVGFGALVSTFGALNGWLLMQAQVPLAIAKDKLFPPIFTRMTKNGVPLIGMVVSSLIVTIIVMSNFTKGLVGMFTFLILLSTFTVLIPYLFSSLAEIAVLIIKKPEGWQKMMIKAILIGIPAFIFSLVAVYGAGEQVVFYGIFCLILGLPIYVLSIYRRNKTIDSKR